MSRHGAALILAELMCEDDCACDFNGIDEWLPYQCQYTETSCPHPGGVKCWEEYLKAKAPDVVEVVRCKDCVYCKRFNDVWYLPKRDELLCTRCVESYHTTESDYCSWGERKDNE